MISTMSGEVSDSRKDCLIIYIPVTPDDNVEDEAPPELDEADCEWRPSEPEVPLSTIQAQLQNMAELSRGIIKIPEARS